MASKKNLLFMPIFLKAAVVLKLNFYWFKWFGKTLVQSQKGLPLAPRAGQKIVKALKH
jgi:hypothetical protein